MLKNYVITAFREILKNKTFSIIHIFGLAMGIAAFVLILQYAFYELSYDNFYKNADHIYRIRQDRYDKGKLSTTWGAGLYPALLISSFKPITIFQGKLNGGSGGAFIRKALVVFQFAASIALIAGTFTVYRQEFLQRIRFR